MQALSCPKCGAPLRAEMDVCPYCRVGLTHDTPASGSAASSSSRQPEQTSVEVPEGWTLHKDPWHGFTIAHPPGWEVVVFQGQISVRADPVGLTSALIWPFQLQQPCPAQKIATQFTTLAQRFNPSYQAWVQGNTSAESTRVSLRTQQIRYGQQEQGVFNILVQGVNVVVSGYEAPAQTIAQVGDTMTRILSTFRTCEMMPRQMAQDPMEGAFTVALPQGWLFQGGVNRNHIGGAGSTQFTICREPQGLVLAGQPWYQWNFMEGGMGILGVFSGTQSARFVPASQFCNQNIAPWMAQFQAELRIEKITERPDLADLAIIELAQAGYPPGMFEVSMAVMETTYTENGVRLRQKSRVATQRQRGGVGTLFESSPMWMAILDVYYRAPDAEFAVWEPVLSGIINSMKVNPAWKAGEQRLAQNYIANSQADIQRRTRQISQTLSETSDIISSGYWERQAVYDTISEKRSNAMLGVQNVASESGEEFKVPYGYDQYWQDGLGNLYGGSWLSQPDIDWKPLTPTGI